MNQKLQQLMRFGIKPGYAEFALTQDENLLSEDREFPFYPYSLIEGIIPQDLGFVQGGSRLQLINESEGVLHSNYYIGCGDSNEPYLTGEISARVKYNISEKVIEVSKPLSVSAFVNYYEPDDEVGWVFEELGSLFSEHQIIDLNVFKKYTMDAFMVMVGEPIIKNDIFVSDT